MKKKSLIIPSVLIALSLVVSIFLTFYMSPFVPYALSDNMPSYKGEKLFYKYYDKLCYFAEKACRYSENESTVYMRTVLFSPGSVMFEKNKRSLPEEFFEKCLCYNQAALDYMEENGIECISEGPYNYYTGYKSGWDRDENADKWYSMIKDEIKSNVAYSLFVLGNVDEAKEYMEKFIEEYKEEYKDSGVSHFPVSLYLTETYALSNDESYRAWVLEKEIDLTAYMKAIALENNQDESYPPEYFEQDNFFKNKSFDELAEVYNQD